MVARQRAKRPDYASPTIPPRTIGELPCSNCLGQCRFCTLYHWKQRVRRRAGCLAVAICSTCRFGHAFALLDCEGATRCFGQ
jgi:hypothetical protein